MNVPSKALRHGDIVAVEENSRKLFPFEEAAAEMGARVTVPYLERSKETMSAKLLHVPTLAEVPLLCEMSMVIEYYSR